MNEYSHKGSLGDIIYSLPAILSLGGGIINIVKKAHYDTLYSLLEIQPNIKINCTCKGINLDKYRKIDYHSNHKKHLAQSHAEVLNTFVDLSKPWLFNIEPIKEAEIIVSRTRRYHDKEEIDWTLLKEYVDKILFLGTKKEYERFKLKRFPALYRYKFCKDGLEMARIIKGSKLFIGNQSFGFSLAEAMKHPRVLEICYAYDNCRPSGDSWYISLTKEVVRQCLLK